MNSTFRRLGPSELLPRYIFAEPLFADRSVLEIGAVASTGGRSAQFLSARGARSVLACDADLGAVDAAQKAFASPDLGYRAEAFEDLRAGSFDLVLIADLAQCVRRPELLHEVRRLLVDQGFLFGGLRNPAGLSLSQLVEPEPSEDAITHEQLVDVLAPCFSHLHIATQSPVLGYQLAFEHGEGLRVDGTLASTGEAAYFVVAAGQRPCPLFEPTWVQLPPEPLAYTVIGVAELASAAAQLGVLSRELEALRHLANGSKDREVELATTVADQETKLEILHRRLAAQDAELAALRRSLPRSSLQVQQIYERATAELTALKAELFRRSESRPAQTGESDAKKG